MARRIKNMTKPRPVEQAGAIPYSRSGIIKVELRDYLGITLALLYPGMNDDFYFGMCIQSGTVDCGIVTLSDGTCSTVNPGPGFVGKPLESGDPVMLQLQVRRE